MGSRSKRAQWANAVVYVAAAGLWLFTSWDGGVTALILPVILMAIAATASPLFKRTSVSHHDAVAASASGSANVVIYHRPACTFCIQMKARLGGLGRRATWVDIWEDEAAAEFVRSVNDGNETVPTVVVDGAVHTNPSPSFVKDHLVH